MATLAVFVLGHRKLREYESSKAVNLVIGFVIGFPLIGSIGSDAASPLQQWFFLL